MSLDDLLNEYHLRFEEAFPIYAFPGTDDEMKKAIGECLEEGKPYKIEYEDGAVY